MQFSSVNKTFERSIKENWNRAALSNYQASTLLYKDVAKHIAELHILFEQCGLAKGDKVAICSRNQMNWGVSFLASTTYGAVPVPVLHEFKPANIHNLVNHSEAKIFFVDDVIYENLSDDEMPDLSLTLQMSNFKTLFAKTQEIRDAVAGLEESFALKYPEGIAPEDLDYYEDSADELALINYTSGTSGFSKGVMIPYRALCSNIEFAKQAEPQMGPGSEVVSMLPSAHMYGMMFEFLFEMAAGAHVNFLTKVPSPNVIMQAFSAVHPDIIIAVPLIIEKIYKSKLKPLIDKNKLLFKIPGVNRIVRNKFRSQLVQTFGGRFEEIILGGAAFNPEVEEFFHSIKFPYTVGYGMTECAPIITYAHWNKAKLYSCGRAALNMEIRVDSEDPQNIPGEVQVKGPNVFLGYYRNEEATASSFTEDGWFKTGDMGVIDSDGFLFLRGRSKCMILGPSGQNIYPEELEAVINNVDAVVESLVIEDQGSLVALIYPDYHQADVEGISHEEFENRIKALLPEINKEIPNYAKIKKMEFLKEDFERTPKRSIKRYLYQRK